MKMWSLQNQLFTLCIALSCVRSAAGEIHVFGYEGKEVHVSCPYPEGYESYEKYLCRNDCGNDDIVITTTERKNKYSIYDDNVRRVFTATISYLNFMDAGKYWCGVSRTGKDIYTEVKLEVRQDRCCDQSTRVQSYETSSVSINCPYEPEYQNNRKYICTGNRPSMCQQQAVITSDNNRKGRFTLNDDKTLRKFTVTITDLTRTDSGSYLCGIHRNTGLDVFSAVELEVKEWCCVQTKKMSGTAGRPLTMQCPYPPQHRDNRKFLCKGDHRNSCANVVTHQSRFSLQDDVSSSSFLVVITELKAEDAATYWCGSDSQWSPASYTKIQLSVVIPQQTSTVRSTSTVISTSTVVEPVGSQSTNISGKLFKDAAFFYPVVYGVPAVLLTLIFPLVIVICYKCKSYKGQGAEVNMNRNLTKAGDTEEVISVEDIYANQDVVACSKKGTSKPQSTCDNYDAGEDQSVYQNFATTEDIYCNQNYNKANKR